MKNQSSNLSLIFLMMIVVLCFSSCNRITEEIIPSAEFAPFINAYTGGVISSHTPIRIEFTDQFPAVEPGDKVDEKLFRFTPKIKGDAYWVDNRTIEFVPDSGSLKPATMYKTTFALGKLLKIDKKFKYFVFTFRVQERDFAVTINPINNEEGNLNCVTVSGEIRLSDKVAGSQVLQMLTVKQGKKKFTPKITPTDDPLSYRFSIDDIPKKEQLSIVEIGVSGKPVGADRKENFDLFIPSISAFELLNSDIILTPEYGICLTFSKPLDPLQDLEGLISLEDDIDYVIQTELNKVNLFFNRPKSSTSITVNIDVGVRSVDGDRMPETNSTTLIVGEIAPQLMLNTQGTILPNAEELILPFRAVNLNAVDVKVVRIFERNILMFLQENTLSQNSYSDLRRSGRLIYKTTIRLDEDITKNIHDWNDYFIDLSKLFKKEPGAIYRIELSFKHAYSAYHCGGESLPFSLPESNSLTKVSTNKMTEADEAIWDVPNTYYYSGVDIDWDVYQWREADNPCHPSYYMNSDRIVATNLLTSNLGVVVKGDNQNQLWVAVADILNTKPIVNAEVNVYNFQLQPIGKGKTDQDGFAFIKPKGKPFVLVASSGGQKTYIRLVDGESNMLSRFDVGGKEVEKGLKGFIYGERGVWRPGDTLYLSFMLEDRENQIPDTHPVLLELYNPRGQFYNKQTSTNGINGFYTFIVPTHSDDPTGIWNAYVKVGGTSFHKSLRIETIKPNRLKVNLTVPGNRIVADKESVLFSVEAAWLTGAIASNMKTKIEMTLSKNSTQFKGAENYTFYNPASRFSANDLKLFEGNLSDKGKLETNIKIPKIIEAPGMMWADILCSVIEPGGDVSIYNTTIPFSPYKTYVGINFNKKSDQSYFETDKNHTFDIITVDQSGKPMNCSNLEYKIYKMGWSWWWEENPENSLSSYINSTSILPVSMGELSTKNGKAQINFKVANEDWGQYFVYVKDREGGHATGGVVIFDYTEWEGRSGRKEPDAIKMLTFSTDKSSYEPGEIATVIIPASKGGRALISIENGSEVLHREWLPVSKSGEVKYKFNITKKMSPNVYVHVTLLQPHKQTCNDLPIRMYGVAPVFVYNKNSKLVPQISLPDVLRPEKEFAVKVREKDGKPMTYTLAIVDEGLLDLTAFKTPDPWNSFYAREALGIKTWDMYDNIIGSAAGRFGSLFSIGGDEGKIIGIPKANRFKPVVRFIGPFVLKKGEEKSHAIKLPPYIGSVRVMVVAGQDGAYGNAEKRVPVRAPLMLLSSLPRVVSTDEEILLPVTVFAMEDNVKNVSVKVTTTGKLQLKGNANQSVVFTKTGDKMIYFSLKTGQNTGVEKIVITATGNGQTAKETIEIDVRNPNPPLVKIENKLLRQGESVEIPYQLENGYEDNSLKLEVSRIPSIDISRRFDFLYDYQHSCTEQLISKALPLLYLPLFKDVDKEENDWIRKSVRRAIDLLYGRQLSNGGFVYWPGNSSANEWISSYAGIFLLQAKEKGYDVNSGVLNRWKNYQRSLARNWRLEKRPDYRYNYTQPDLNQAYRLYSLALASEPEMGAMNRMKEIKEMSIQGKWRLAAAYALAGKRQIAQEMVFNVATNIVPYSLSNNTYGSADRDEAMILETMLLLDRYEEAFKLAQKIADRLSKERYYNTQSTAFALMAMGKLAQKTAGTLDFEWSFEGKKLTAIKSATAIWQKDIDITPTRGSVVVKHQGSGLLYVSLLSKTKPIQDQSPALQNGVKIDIRYNDSYGKSIDISNLKQGTDFTATVRITNLNSTENYTDMALTHIFPSGWEIRNERLFRQDDGATDRTITYQDIRDDRILTYFDLPAGKSKEIVVKLTASYSGSFILPAVQCEVMYSPSVQARSKAGRVKVTPVE